MALGRARAGDGCRGCFSDVSPDAAGAAESATIPVATATVSSSPTPSPSPTPTKTQESSWPILEDGWITEEVVLATDADVWDLDQAPEEFQSYIAGIVGEADDYGCTTEVHVYAMHPDGFVYGVQGGLDCGGGAHVIWSDKGGEWEELFGMQDLLPCEDIANAGVPENMGVLECVSGDEVYYY